MFRAGALFVWNMSVGPESNEIATVLRKLKVGASYILEGSTNFIQALDPSWKYAFKLYNILFYVRWIVRQCILNWCLASEHPTTGLSITALNYKTTRFRASSTCLETGMYKVQTLLLLESDLFLGSSSLHGLLQKNLNLGMCRWHKLWMTCTDTIYIYMQIENCLFSSLSWFVFCWIVCLLRC